MKSRWRGLQSWSRRSWASEAGVGARVLGSQRAGRGRSQSGARAVVWGVAWDLLAGTSARWSWGSR